MSGLTNIAERFVVSDAQMNVAHVSCAYNAEAILAWALKLEPSLVGMEDKVGRLPLHWCTQPRTISLTAAEISFGTHTH